MAPTKIIGTGRVDPIVPSAGLTVARPDFAVLYRSLNHFLSSALFSRYIAMKLSAEIAALPRSMKASVRVGFHI